MKQLQPPKNNNVLDEIKKLEVKRQQRRIKMEQFKKQKQQRKALNLASGKNVDIDFELMIQKNKFKEKILQPHISSTAVKLSVCVRKRPLFKKQQQGGQIDAVSCANPKIKIHQPKYKVDGITKYIDNHLFTFDNTFNQQQKGSDIYKFALKPLLPSLLQQGIVTCFAYGQTGSGKTFTMNQIQQLVVQQLYLMIENKYKVSVSFFQIYGGRCLDLLNSKSVLTILQDKNNNIQIQGLQERNANNSKQLFKIMQQGNSIRTTHATVANDTSSRSHSICQILVRQKEEIVGKLILVDLAGSQRAQDTQSNNRQRRIQGAQINKSLLALKQCIRAMDDKADHVPFRASKLTLVLRDSFINKNNKCKVVMIACISPGTSSADHSLNTLRYADRLKDRTGQKLTQIYESNKDILCQQKNLNRIDSVKELKRQQVKQKAIQKQPIPSIPNNKNNQIKIQKKQVIKPIQNIPKKNQEKPQRNVSVNKSMNNNKNIQNKQNRDTNNREIKEIEKKQSLQELQEQLIKPEKNKVKDNVRVMKQTMKNQKKQQFFDFHQKVSNILDQQQQIFATHMAAIKQDAKLLTQQSQLIANVQQVGLVDYDIDKYVEKLQSVIKRKLKMYMLVSKKLQSFKNNLKQQDEIRRKVTDTFYY